MALTRNSVWTIVVFVQLLAVAQSQRTVQVLATIGNDQISFNGSQGLGLYFDPDRSPFGITPGTNVLNATPVDLLSATTVFTDKNLANYDFLMFLAVPASNFNTSALYAILSWVTKGGQAFACCETLFHGLCSSGQPIFGWDLVNISNGSQAQLLMQNKLTYPVDNDTTVPFPRVIDGPFGFVTNMTFCCDDYGYFRNTTPPENYTIIATLLNNRPAIIEQEIGLGRVILTGDCTLFQDLVTSPIAGPDTFLSGQTFVKNLLSLQFCNISSCGHCSTCDWRTRSCKYTLSSSCPILRTPTPTPTPAPTPTPTPVPTSIPGLNLSNNSLTGNSSTIHIDYAFVTNFSIFAENVVFNFSQYGSIETPFLYMNSSTLELEFRGNPLDAPIVVSSCATIINSTLHIRFFGNLTSQSRVALTILRSQSQALNCTVRFSRLAVDLPNNDNCKATDIEANYFQIFFVAVCSVASKSGVLSIFAILIVFLGIL